MKTCYTYFTAKLTKYFHIIVTYWLQFGYASTRRGYFIPKGHDLSRFETRLSLVT